MDFTETMALEIDTTALAPTAVQPSRMLHGKLAVVRRRELCVLIGTGLSWFVLVAAGTLLVMMALDWRYELPRSARAVLLLLALGCWGLVGWRRLWQPVTGRVNVEGAALLVERAAQEFRGRLIAAIQLARAEVAYEADVAPFVRALLAQTERIARLADFRRAVRTDRLLRLLALVTLVAVAGGWTFGRGDPLRLALLRRAFLSGEPLPRKTRVTCLTGNKRVGRGATVVLQAQVAGIVPRSGLVRLKFESGRVAEFTLEPEKDNRVLFSRAISSVQESFSYEMRLNDGRSGPDRIEVVAPPVVVALNCRQEFPAYTKLPPVPRQPTELTLLAGSRLQIVAHTSKDLSRGVVRLVGLRQELPLRLGAKDPRTVTATVAIPEKDLTGFALHLFDKEGAESNDDPVYPITILADKPPVVTITYPLRREELVTKQARVLVGFEANDDYGVAKLIFHCRVGDDPAGTKSVELDLGGKTVTMVRRRYEWSLSELLPAVNVGDSVTYWVEAIDNNTATTPGNGVSDRYALRVVSDDEKRAELMRRLDEEMNKVTGIARDQGRLNERLGDVIFDREKRSLQPGE